MLSITPNHIYSGLLQDSGATRHMCAYYELFANLRTYAVKKIRVADRGLMDVDGEGGSCYFKAFWTCNGSYVLIKNGKCEVFSSEIGKVILTGKMYHKVYISWISTIAYRNHPKPYQQHFWLHRNLNFGASDCSFVP